MLVSNRVFTEYKGAFTDLYVLTQLRTLNLPIYYYSISNSTIELDFLLQYADKVWPIEVKAENNVHAKSLRTFIANNPHLKGLRFSMLPYQLQDWMINIPLYACLNVTHID